MRTSWTNLILHTTSLIYRRKQGLLVSHSLQSVLDVFIIVFLEIFLAIISFPLYLVSKESDIGGKKQYKIRRIISLSLLLTILAIWILKLTFIVALPLYFDTKQAFYISEKNGQGQTVQSNYILPNTYNAQTDASIPVPIIDGVLKADDGKLSIKGKGSVDTNVILSIGKEGTTGSSVDFYITTVDLAGNWVISTDVDNLRLAPGKYRLQAMTYNSVVNKKSSLASVESFQIEESWHTFIDKADVYLNYFVVTFLVLSIFSIILLI